MNEKDYVKQAMRTAANPAGESAIKKKLSDDRTIRLLHAAMGLATESGEFADALKVHIFYSRDLDTKNLIEELGDLFWYCAIASDALGVSFEEIQRLNIEKLRARYGDKFTDAAASNRDLAAERWALDHPTDSIKKD